MPGAAMAATPVSGRGPRLIVELAVAAFLLRVILRLHGFSLPLWHAVIDQSPMREVLVGHPQAVRSDDWAVVLPLALVQSAEEPRFPVVNPLIGNGQSGLASYSLPMWHPITLFRPQVWGYFLGPDTGLAW